MPVDERGLMGLAGKRIEAITRIAKYICLLAGKRHGFHLGMSGKLICVAKNFSRFS